MRCFPRRFTVSAFSCASFTLLFFALCLPGCEEDGLQGAKSEVKESKIQLDLPAVPTFEMPSPHPDGTHSVREMRLRGRKLFETDVEIKGFVTWIYDCAAELKTPEMTDKDVQKIMEENPDKCNRPHFFLGDTGDTESEKSIWIVENPRKLRKDELKALTSAERKALPPVPEFVLGDEVVVKGTWDNRSPHGFANSDGLLVFKEMQNLTTPEPEKKR